MTQTIPVTTFESLLFETLEQTIQKTGDPRKMSHFEQAKILGFPQKKSEAYKFTPILNELNKRFTSVQIAKPMDLDLQTWNTIKETQTENHIVFINGKYHSVYSETNDPALSIVENIKIDSTNEEMIQDLFYQLNQASTPGSLSLTSKKGKTANPVVIYHIVTEATENAMVSPCIILASEESSTLSIFEKTVVLTHKPVFLNKITYCHTAKNSTINLTKIQNNGSEIVEVDGIFNDQDRDSKFYINTYTFGGGLIRNNLWIRQNDQNCESHMHGLYLINGNSHVDNYTAVDHRNPNCYSNELYKGILDEKSTAVFNGKIYVRPGAQQINAFQSNNNISLSEHATIHTKPQLEIWADDVKCSHGCTIGQLDEEALFYLRARGLDEKTAKAMLLVAFAEASFEHIPFEYVKVYLHEMIQNRLN